MTTTRQDQIAAAREQKKRRRHRPISPLPRWVAVVFLAVCLGLIPQIVNLNSTLTQTAMANHWRAVWVGLDIAEALAFLLNAWLLYLRSALVVITASVAATLLWLDAWFDVLTSLHRQDLDAATNLAIFAEIPLGFFCFFVALRTLGLLRRRGSERDFEGDPDDPLLRD
jgi:hypothetical protein